MMEKPLGFPYNRIYKEHLRQGIYARFSFLASRGYDIWLYSSGYESLDYVRDLLKHYHAQVTGIITGAARKAPREAKTREELEKLVSGKCSRTVHADNDSILITGGPNRIFSGNPATGTGPWTAEVMEAMNGIKTGEL